MNSHPTQPENSGSSDSTMLSDSQMDGLLTAFFDHEVPQQLKAGATTTARQSDVVASPAATTSHAASRATSPARGLTAIVGMLAACSLIVVAGWRISSVVDSPASPVVNQQPDSGLDDDRLMDVSTAPEGDMAVDENQTTLEEIDQIDLSPEGSRN
jgi:hypothetical protein